MKQLEFDFNKIINQVNFIDDNAPYYPMEFSAFSRKFGWYYKCTYCCKPLLFSNRNIADGCPCNGPRGINHEKVAVLTCTCSICDPALSGSSRNK